MICWGNTDTKVVGVINHYLIGLQSTFMRWKPSLVVKKLRQTRKVMNLMEDQILLFC